MILGYYWWIHIFVVLKLHGCNLSSTDKHILSFIDKDLESLEKYAVVTGSLHFEAEHLSVYAYETGM